MCAFPACENPEQIDAEMCDLHAKVRVHPSYIGEGYDHRAKEASE